MQSKKIVRFYVYKPEDYKPIPLHEKQRISLLVSKSVLEVANRFDGTSSFTITIHAKGNA